MNEIKNANVFGNLWNNAAQKASETFSKMVGYQSFINISETITTNPMTLYKQFGESESHVFTTALRVEGDLNGFILVIWPKDQAKTMSKELVKSKNQKEDLTDIEKSSLEEVANIVTSSFLTEINKTTKLKIVQSIPESASDMLKAILDEISAYVAQSSTNALMLITKLELTPINSSAFFAIALDAESGKKLIEKLSNEQ